MFQIILLAVFGASAIAGVLIFSLAVGGRDSASIGNVTIWGTFPENKFTDALRGVSDQDERLLTVTYVQKDSDTYMEELTNALASGTGPDLYMLRQDYAIPQESRVRLMPYVGDSSVAISAETFRQIFADSAEPFLAPGGLIGIPLLIDPLVLYWNRDILNSNGFAKPPQYWDELHDMASALTKKTETGAVTRATIPFGQFRNVNNAKNVLSMLIMQAGGQIVNRNSEGALEPALSNASEGAAQATLAAARFFTEFADPSKPDYTWNASLPEARKSFIAGNLALYIGLASEKELIEQANPNLNFSVAPIPQRRNAQRSIDAGFTYAFAIPRTSKNPAGARQVAFILAQRSYAKLFSDAIGIPSARRDLLGKLAAADPEPTVEMKQAIIVRSWPDPDPQKTGEIFRAMIEDTVNGSLIVAEAIQRADQQLAEVMKPYLEARQQQAQ